MLQHLPQAEAVPACNEAEHHEHKQDAGQIHAAHERHELAQGGEAVFANGEGHRAKRSDRCGLGHHADDTKEHLSDHVQEIGDRFDTLTKLRKCDAG